MSSTLFSSLSWRRFGSGILPWLLPLLILAGWEYSARSGLLSTRVLPEPWAVAKAAWHLV